MRIGRPFLGLKVRGLRSKLEREKAKFCCGLQGTEEDSPAKPPSNWASDGGGDGGFRGGIGTGAVVVVRLG